MAKIQSAQTLPRFEHDNYMLVGPAGGGKSTLACTLPGKTLVYCFDESGASAYQKASRHTGHVDIMSYIGAKKDLTPYSTKDLKKGANPQPAQGMNREDDQTYFEFAKDITRMVNEGEIVHNYQNCIIDSGTTLQSLVMAAILSKEGRAGQVPQLSDYGTQMNIFEKISAQVFSLPANVVLILHDEFVQDKETSKFQYQLILTGKMKGRLPNKVNHLIRCTAEGNRDKGTRYFIQTVPDRYSEGIRTSFEGLPFKHDVTIENFSKIQSYGLGRIITEAKRSLQPSGISK